MKICIPVNEIRDGQSSVCAHFGSAPAFVIVNTQDGTYQAIVRGEEHMCGAIDTLQSERVESIIVGGIGMGALNRLAAAGIKVFAAQYGTVDENVAALKGGQLPLMMLDRACAHHGHGHDHDHGGSCGKHGQ